MGVDNVLLHYGKGHDDNPPGRGSGRYPFGSGKSRRISLKRKKTVTSDKKEPEKQLSKEEAKALYEKEKARALKSGTAKDIIKFKGDLTNQEMRDAIQRMDLERQLSTYDQKFIKSKKEQLNDVMKDLRMVTEWTKIGTEAYNAMANIYNATEKGKKKPLNIVSTGGGGKKKK